MFGAISKKWTKPEEQFVENARCQVDSKLGDVQLIKVAKNAGTRGTLVRHARLPMMADVLSAYATDTGAKTFVATVIAQDSSLKGLPFNETAFEEAISRLAGYARKEKASVHVPRFSSAIPDMNWDAVQNVRLSLSLATALRNPSRLTVGVPGVTDPRQASCSSRDSSLCVHLPCLSPHRTPASEAPP